MRKGGPNRAPEASALPAIVCGSGSSSSHWELPEKAKGRADPGARRPVRLRLTPFPSGVTGGDLFHDDIDICIGTGRAQRAKIRRCRDTRRFRCHDTDEAQRSPDAEASVEDFLAYDHGSYVNWAAYILSGGMTAA